MKFENLKYFFNNEISIRIDVDKIINANYVKIHSILDEERVVLYNFEQVDNIEFIEGHVSKNDAYILRYATDKTRDYFAKVIDSKKDFFVISIISFNKIPLISTLDIGIGDTDTSYLNTTENLEKEYVLNIGSKKYYVHGKHKNAKSNIFSIMNNASKYDVKLMRRDEAGAVLDKTIGNEQVWAITNKASAYKKDDYLYEIRPYKINLSNVSSAKAASEQNKLEMKHLNDDGIFGRWIKFTEEDFEISKEKIDAIGLLKYIDYVKTSYEFTFTIEDDKEKIERLIKYNNDSQDNLFLENYIGIQEINKKSNRKRAKFRLKEIHGNKLICHYDGDSIIEGNGYLQISISGAAVILQRRKEAIERIKSDRAAKKNIMQLIEGKSLSSSRTKKTYRVENFIKEIEAAFDGKRPNETQLEAIEIAINTPDFAIIQGPPGCGKTSLINAIDNCLAKIDSSLHKKASSLSTAYQKESTRNMVTKKNINGLPVPFITSKYQVEIEAEFQEYIDNVAEKLKIKYPELVKNIYKKASIDILTANVSSFNPETATFDSLLFFLNNVIDCTYDSSLYEQREQLLEIQKNAQNKLKKILEPNKDQTLYYIRIIPSSSLELEDEGLKTFFTAKINLKVLYPSLNKLVEEIEKLYRITPIDFEKIVHIKNEMIFKVKNIEHVLKDTALNKKAQSLVYEIKYKYEEETTYDNESLIIQYVESFINNKTRVRQALEQWITSIAATHQISSDNEIIKQDVKNDEEFIGVEYNTVLIDEAARSCPPDLLIPIASAKNRIIMVGDHKQLPQFVNDEVLQRIKVEEITKKEMKNISMFEFLIDSSAKLQLNDSFKRFIALNNQYRMPKILGDFIGDNFYPEIGLNSPRGNPNEDKDFIQTLPLIENKAMVWCDVPYGRDIKLTNRGTINVEEARTIAKMINKFLNDNNNTKISFGVMSFYKDQVKLIIKELVNFNIYMDNENTNLNESYVINKLYENRIRIDTVDAFQGLEFDVVILSMVRSNPMKKFSNKSFGFLRDERRLCVSLSRQKRCLIVVGNGSGMLETEVAESSVKALVNYYKKCKEGSEYVGFIESKNIN